MSFEAPNLDAMPVSELLDFWRKHRQDHTILFPGGGRDTKLVNNLLCNYALNKKDAMTSRLKGDILPAASNEANCDRLYQKLPTWARW